VNNSTAYGTMLSRKKSENGSCTVR